MRGIVYVMQRSIQVNGDLLKPDQAAFIEDIKALEFKAMKDSQFMICMGMPHGESIRQYGSFVD